MSETEFEKRRDNYVADKKQLIEYVMMLEQEINWRQESYNKLDDINISLNEQISLLKKKLDLRTKQLEHWLTALNCDPSVLEQFNKEIEAIK